MSKLTKSDLIRTAANEANVTQGTTKEVIDAAFAALANLPVGGSVTVHGFGKFTMKATKATSGTSPNGKAWEKPAGQKLTFTASKAA